MRVLKAFSMSSPSKYTSLSRLLQIKKDNYVGEMGLDYCPFETEVLIIEKKNKLAAEQVSACERWERHQARLLAIGLSEAVLPPPLFSEKLFKVRY